MTDVVLDASAVLAVLHQELGAESVEPHLPGGYLSTVNAAEVATRLVDGGADPVEAADRIFRLGPRVVAFEAADVAATARLRKIRGSASLSLADRACLALAQRLGVPAVTADRAWAELSLGIDVRLIR